MPRVLGSNTRNKIEIYDGVGNGVAVFYTRNILPSERVKYLGSLIKKDEKGVTFLDNEVRLQNGSEILTGIEDNYFQDSDGTFIASDKHSPNYKEDWKELIIKHASELVMMVAVQMFESNRILSVNQAMANEIDTEPSPLANGSGDS